MDWEAIWLSVQLASLTTLILFVIGLPFAYWIANTRWRFKFMVEAVVSLPMILPPTVLGFYLLIALGAQSPVGRRIEWVLNHLGIVPTVERDHRRPIGSVIDHLRIRVGCQELETPGEALIDGYRETVVDRIGRRLEF